MSHVVAFLALHEATAVVPLLGLVGLFKWAGWTPTAFVLGPWAEWAQEGLRSYGAWLRRRGWFGLRGREERSGEERFEGVLDEEVARVRRGEGGERGKEEGMTGEEGGGEEAPDGLGGKTRSAWHKVKKVVTVDNLESGYNTGIQIAAAYTITKALLPVRIAVSIWATPWGARVLTAIWRAMRPKA